LSLSELVNLFKVKRTEYLGGKKAKSLLIKEVKTGVSIICPSISFVKLYLKSKNIKANEDTIVKYVDSGKPYLGYLYSTPRVDKPLNEESYQTAKAKLDLLIEENLRELKENTEEFIKSANKVPLFVKSISGERFSFPSTKNAIEYFKTQGVILNTKMLKKKISKGEDYKGFIFSFKP
jgi:hypothetical protein